MKITIMPGVATGEIFAPPSKSMAHRMLMGAALAEGISVVDNIDLSEDIRATLDVLHALGGEYHLHMRTLTMKGIGAQKVIAKRPLDCKESGSTLRFFIPIVLTGGEDAEFTGAKRLFERPLDIYEEICKSQGIAFEKWKKDLRVSGKLAATHYRVKGNISSQFITGLLFALPLLEGDSVLEVLPPIESKAYIDMTLETLDTFGIKIKQEGAVYYIPGNQHYRANNVRVEGDYSNAAFLDALNMIGGNVRVKGLLEDTLQGDQVYRSYFQVLKEEEPVLDLAECPDLGPILMGLAAVENGARFTGTRRLRMKESDRGAAMAQELSKFGIQVDVMENDIIVHKGTLRKPTEVLCSHNDHRIVMTMATLCTITGGTIEQAESVRKSFPNYFDVLEELGICIAREE